MNSKEGYKFSSACEGEESVHVEFRKCNPAREISALRSFDRKVFSKGDLFTASEWRQYTSYWMILGGTVIGCCAFEHNVDFQEDLRNDESNQQLEGSLYIASTGILPSHQGKGLGRLLKSWEITYAKYHGFTRIVTNTRKKNRQMISLNRKFGFQIIRETRGYYSNPSDSTVVMELKL
jgi:ribosomal protein S18 acetylase RimI-like enzyme